MKIERKCQCGSEFRCEDIGASLGLMAYDDWRSIHTAHERGAATNSGAISIGLAVVFFISGAVIGLMIGGVF